jgi:hypothetical protein
VASLIAEIGADTKGFDTGAAKVKGGLGSLASGFGGLLTSTALVTAGIAAVEKGFEQTVGSAQKYDQVIYGIMASTGGTADQTSRMVQVLDDAGVGFETVKKAMKEMGKDGIAPSMDELARLADEFVKIQDPAEKVKFQLDHFGKSGQDMARALSMGGAALRKMNDEMSGGLILTEENIKASEEYRKNLDTLNDSISGFQMKAGNEMIPVLNQIVTGMNYAAQGQEDYNRRLQESIALNGDRGDRMNNILVLQMKETEELYAARDAVNAHADALDNSISTLEEHTGAVEIDDEAVKELTRSNSEFLSIIGSITEQQSTYESQVAAINQEYEEGKITMEERGIALQELADKQEEASNRMILSMLQQNLAVDGLSTAEMKYLLETGMQWGIYSRSAVDSAQAAIDKAAELEDEFLNLPTDHTMTITINTVGGMGTFEAPELAMRGRSVGVKRHASGGDFMIPMSYGNEGFKMGNGDTASGGERVSITPRGQQPDNASIQLAALVGAIPSARDNAKALARELMKMGIGSR